MSMPEAARTALRRGLAIPAHPLALDAQRRLDERRQRALSRYYLAAGAGGLAVGVHTTQFAIREPAVGLLEPVLSLAAEEMDRADEANSSPILRVAGACGGTAQAVREAQLARERGYHAVLLSLAAMRRAGDAALLAHCRAVSEVLPLFGFYLQPAVGGRPLDLDFWRGLAGLEELVAIKIAPFDRYATLDVVRAVAESGRNDVALYTGNDDNILLDLLTPYPIPTRGDVVVRRMVGGLLGHWAVWTRRAVELFETCRDLAERHDPVPPVLLERAVEVTDANRALFDATHGFRGCIAGIHEVLRGQGLLEGIWCLDPQEGLSRGQQEEIERVRRAYPHLLDDGFVAEHRDRWLSG